MRLYEMTDTKGSYAAVSFDATTTDALKAYQYDNHIPNPLSPDEFHSTVMFSKKYIPTFKPLGELDEWSGTFTKFDIFLSDDDNALVLKYDCHQLSERFDQIISKYGATWEYDSFTPHITLSYNVEDLDIDQLPKYDGPIILINEYTNDLDLGWAESHK